MPRARWASWARLSAPYPSRCVFEPGNRRPKRRRSARLSAVRTVTPGRPADLSRTPPRARAPSARASSPARARLIRSPRRTRCEGVVLPTSNGCSRTTTTEAGRPGVLEVGDEFGGQRRGFPLGLGGASPARRTTPGTGRNASTSVDRPSTRAELRDEAEVDSANERCSASAGGEVRTRSARARRARGRETKVRRGTPRRGSALAAGARDPVGIAASRRRIATAGTEADARDAREEATPSARASRTPRRAWRRTRRTSRSSDASARRKRPMRARRAPPVTTPRRTGGCAKSASAESFRRARDPTNAGT